MKRTIMSIILAMGLGIFAAQQSFAQGLLNRAFTPEQLKQAEAKAKQIEEDRIKNLEAKKKADAEALKASGLGKMMKIDDAMARKIVDESYSYDEARALIKAHILHHSHETVLANVEVNIFNKTLTRVPLAVCEAMRKGLITALVSEFKVELALFPGSQTAIETAYGKTYTCAPSFLQAYKNLASKDPVIAKAMKKYASSIDAMLLSILEEIAKDYASQAKTESGKLLKSAASTIKDVIKSIV